MVRAFSPEPIAPDAVERLLDNARRGPSAGFSQGTEFLVLDTEADRDAFWATALPSDERDTFPWEGILAAPVLIAVVPGKDIYLDRYAEPDKGWTDRDEAHWPAPFWDVDAGMAALLVLLTTVDLGLGALFFGLAPDRTAAVMDRFAIPPDRRPVGFIAVGHRLADRPSSSLSRGRRSLDEVVHRGRWATKHPRPR
jgi:nitroreductase